MDQIFGDLIRGIVSGVQAATSTGEKIRALQIAESYLTHANDYVRRELITHLKTTDDAIDAVKKIIDTSAAAATPTQSTPPIVADDKSKKLVK